MTFRRITNNRQDQHTIVLFIVVLATSLYLSFRLIAIIFLRCGTCVDGAKPGEAGYCRPMARKLRGSGGRKRNRMGQDPSSYGMPR